MSHDTHDSRHGHNSAAPSTHVDIELDALNGIDADADADAVADHHNKDKISSSKSNIFRWFLTFNSFKKSQELSIRICVAMVVANILVFSDATAPWIGNNSFLIVLLQCTLPKVTLGRSIAALSDFMPSTTIGIVLTGAILTLSTLALWPFYYYPTYLPYARLALLPFIFGISWLCQWPKYAPAITKIMSVISMILVFNFATLPIHSMTIYQLWKMALQLWLSLLFAHGISFVCAVLFPWPRLSKVEISSRMKRVALSFTELSTLCAHSFESPNAKERSRAEALLFKVKRDVEVAREEIDEGLVWENPFSDYSIHYYRHRIDTITYIESRFRAMISTIERFTVNSIFQDMRFRLKEDVSELFKAIADAVNYCILIDVDREHQTKNENKTKMHMHTSIHIQIESIIQRLKDGLEKVGQTFFEARIELLNQPDNASIQATSMKEFSSTYFFLRMLVSASHRLIDSATATTSNGNDKHENERVPIFRALIFLLEGFRSSDTAKEQKHRYRFALTFSVAITFVFVFILLPPEISTAIGINTGILALINLCFLWPTSMATPSTTLSASKIRLLGTIYGAFFAYVALQIVNPGHPVYTTLFSIIIQLISGIFRNENSKLVDVVLISALAVLYGDIDSVYVYGHGQSSVSVYVFTVITHVLQGVFLVVIAVSVVGGWSNPARIILTESQVGAIAECVKSVKSACDRCRILNDSHSQVNNDNGSAKIVEVEDQKQKSQLDLEYFIKQQELTHILIQSEPRLWRRPVFSAEIYSLIHAQRKLAVTLEWLDDSTKILVQSMSEERESLSMILPVARHWEELSELVRTLLEQVGKAVAIGSRSRKSGSRDELDLMDGSILVKMKELRKKSEEGVPICLKDPNRGSMFANRLLGSFLASVYCYRLTVRWCRVLWFASVAYVNTHRLD